MQLGERRCVANDITVAARQTLLIAGPSAGGKTVALKTVGLAALMAREGLHLTCESGSVIGWFHDLITDIGDAPNLEQDLSTFSGHIVNLRDVMTSAALSLLVLIDEIAVGTDPIKAPRSRRPRSRRSRRARRAGSPACSRGEPRSDVALGG